MSRDTPLMQQYQEIKARHTDAILMFRMGDFYEMFFGDAEVAARELGLTLTSRNNGAAADVPLAGVPVKAVGEYVRRLVERGHRVAICDQVEDPKLAKGIVRREVVETVTPGAALAEHLLQGTNNNFLVAILPGAPAGIAALDLSTGEFALDTVAASDDLRSRVERFAPREIILPTGEAPPLPTDGLMVTRREPWEFDAAAATQEIQRRFGLASLDGLGIETQDRPALAAAGGLLAYARELQPGGLPHLARPAVSRGGDSMVLDEMTRRNLELVEPLRVGEGATLITVLDRTMTPMGARLLRRRLLAPLRDVAAIRERLDAVETLHADTRGRGRLREALDGVRDVERLAGRAAAGRASPRDLGALRDSLARLPDVTSALGGLTRRDQSARLSGIAARFDLLSDLTSELAAVLSERPPAQLGDGDTVRPGADAALDEARDLRDGGKRFIAAIQTRERERTGIATLKVGYNRVFGYFIEISRSQRGAVPADYERRQTLANAERYATAELKEYEARVLGAEEQVLDRERFLVQTLCRAVQERIGRVQAAAQAVAELDVHAALAETAATERYVRPDVTDDMTLDLKACRHPSVERMLPPGKFIPNDVQLDDEGRVILLTGPNMAGKSTVLRQVGLTVLLAQVGAFVPADSARVGVADRIFTRVGASDNLSRGQSTFMVEMGETSAILHGATSRSLVLLDEIGRGTSTFDGVAIAWAVTEHLHERVKCRSIFATHYHELVQLADELPHARNWNVAVREVGSDVVFLHRLEPGGADRSYGIHVARLAGLPASLLQRAQAVLASLEAGHHVATPAPPDPQQLTLFVQHPVLRDLLGVDVNAMTPLDAIQLLAELKRRAGAS